MRISKSITLAAILTGLVPSVAPAQETDFEKEFSYWHKQLMNWDIHQNEVIFGLLTGIQTSHVVNNTVCYKLIAEKIPTSGDLFRFYASLVKDVNPQALINNQSSSIDLLGMLINIEIANLCKNLKEFN